MAEPIEARLAAMGLALPATCTPRGNFLAWRRDGDLLFMAGQICEWNGEVPYQGPVIGPAQAAPKDGPSIDLETARDAARVCALNLLFFLREACEGDLGRLERVIRLGGFVQCLPGFASSPEAINGASDLLIDLFGEAGRHARTAVGVAGLPGNASIEVDAIFRLGARRRAA